MMKIEIIQPDDFHLHLRDEKYMESVVQDSARIFGKVLVMPNLQPPICNPKQAEQYHQRIISQTSSFKPFITLYLTENTTEQEVIEAKKNPILLGYKYYPAGATTHSEQGVRKLKNCTNILKKLEQLDIPLQIHGEVTDSKVDIFDREKVFIKQVLIPLLDEFPKLKVVLEHITTKQSVEFIEQSKKRIAATITAHHLLKNRNDLFQGGINPHHYCLPILKREEHRQALLKAATSGNPKFFLGTDSAPHSINKKHSECGCAGIYTAHKAIEFYAQAFDSIHQLEKLEKFSSYFGSDFYGLKRNKKRITLQKEQQQIPNILKFGKEELIPFEAGKMIPWKATV